MRFKSAKTGGFQVFSVTGTNTISFGMSATAAARKGLLGFAVERIDHKEAERYFLSGMKVFPSVIPHPDETTRVSTYDHPIQSFVWDDFTGKPGRPYTYLFYPLRGKPKNLDHSAAPVSIDVETEELFTQGTHDIFFNRGVASSQAYVREFKNRRPDKIEDAKERERALEWLSRQLDDAMLRFIHQAKKGDELFACFYEFRYLPVAEALAKSVKAGVKLRLIVDAKDKPRKDKKGKLLPPFPREENLKMLKQAGIAKASYVLREMRPNNIQHNKFMVLKRKGKQEAEQVWTGSTNLSMGGIHGQTNVGHWVRDVPTAQAFKAYWDILEADPGAADGTTPEGKTANIEFAKAVEDLSPTLKAEAQFPAGVTPLFSPRRGLQVLARYVAMLSSAQTHASITLAFGVGKDFRDALLQHDETSPLTFLLLEKEDKPNPKSKDVQNWKPVNSKHNVYKAFGSYLENAVYQFAKETNARALKLNEHVAYIHSKFLLVDPLGADPMVVTGSANFSSASTSGNDENMLVIRGERRVADIYFTEFNRLFFHYYFRSVVEQTSEAGGGGNAEGTQFLEETPEKWLVKYEPGKLRAKRVQVFERMAI
jgi:phosphatidylserine/phosphatidylglycerophosphate/cardiolipin synthase-like enzyme